MVLGDHLGFRLQEGSVGVIVGHAAALAGEAEDTAIVVKGFPEGKARAVGVAGFGKVCPVALHGTGKRPVLLGIGPPGAVQGAELIAVVAGVGDAGMVLSGLLLVKNIGIYRLFPPQLTEIAQGVYGGQGVVMPAAGGIVGTFVGGTADDDVHVPLTAASEAVVHVLRQHPAVGIEVEAAPEAELIVGLLQDLGGQIPHFFNGMAAQLLHEGHALGVHGLPVPVGHPAAYTAARLDGGMAEVILGQGGATQGCRGSGTAGLAKAGDIVRVAAKEGDVLMNPFQRLDHVQDAIVAAAAVFTLGLQLRVGVEAEHIQAVGDGNQDHALGAEAVAAVLIVGAVPLL